MPPAPASPPVPTTPLTTPHSHDPADTELRPSHTGPGRGRGTLRLFPLDGMTATLATEGLRAVEALVRVLRGPDGERLRLPVPVRFPEVEHAISRARELLPYASGRRAIRTSPAGRQYLHLGATPGVRRRLARYLFDLGAFLASSDHVPAPDACVAGQLREAATRCLRIDAHGKTVYRRAIPPRG